MKTHLLRPGEGVTMCHLKLWTRPQTFKDLCREYPTEVTCAFCLEVYDNRQEWFWGELTRIKTPAGQKWADVDTPMIYPIEIVKSNPSVKKGHQ